MAKKIIVCLVTILSYVSYNSFAGGKDKVNLNCYNGKWTISSVKYQRPTGLIIIQKKVREEAARLSEQLVGGTITFIEGKKVTFSPPGDTTIYNGEVEKAVRFNNDGNFGSTSYHSHTTAEVELLIIFTGEGAKYNFNMLYHCPVKNKPGFEAVNFADNISYEFVRTVE